MTNEELLRQSIFDIYNSSNDLIFILDKSHRIIFANEALQYKLGFRQEEIINQSIESLIHSEVVDNLLDKIGLLNETNQSIRLSAIMHTKNSKKIYVNGTVNQMSGLYGKDSFRCVFYDVSERVRAESFQSLFFSIASLTSQEYDLEMLHNRIFNELSRHFKVKNYSIAQLDGTHGRFSFRETDKPDQLKKLDLALCAYTAERAKPLIIYEEGIIKIAQQQNLKTPKKLPKVWLGVPFSAAETKFVITISSTADQNTYNHKDLELLDFIGGQISVATDRKKNQEKITEQAARIHAIFESSTHQIWTLDKKFRFTSFNEKYAENFRRYFGKMPEPGMSISDMYNQKLDVKIRETWYSRYKDAFNGKIQNFQSSVIDSKGQNIWRDVYISPIYLPDGRIEEISLIANDITEKKNAEKALIDSEEKFRNIVESFQDVYFRCNMNGKITMVSPSVHEILGYQPNEMLGKPLEGYFINKNNLRYLIKRLLAEVRVRDFEAQVSGKQNQKINLLCNIRLIRSNNSETEIEGVAKDITQLKQTNLALQEAKELAERSLKIKERFLANMSHEIRTPMNGVIGMIDLLGTTALNKEQGGYLRTIRKSSESLMTILNDILDLSKIEAGKMELKPEPIHLMETVAKVYELFSQQAHINNTHLYYYIDDHVPDLVLADETRLVQVISNLTSNAIKFSQKQGNISISLRLEEKLKTGYLFRLSVKDSGIGIHPTDQQKLFTSFSQLDSSNKKQFAGTGLGLAISKELVKSMKGDIGVVSTPGFGSTFWFTFEAGKPGKDQKKIKKATAKPQVFIKNNPRILLVDDNEINRKVAEGILSKAGCLVTTAASGTEAIKLMNKHEIDLIFMDIQMPDMDGIEAMLKIRELPLKRMPPVIAMTAYSMEEDRVRFLEQGMDDYLPKPIQSQVMIEKVREWTEFAVQEVETTIFKPTSEKLIINQNTLNQLHKYGGKELIREVLEEFREEASEIMKASEICMNNKDYECIREQMHTLKGNAGTLGIEKLSAQAALVEKRIKENKFERVKPELIQLKKAMAQFNDNYQNILRNE